MHVIYIFCVISGDSLPMGIFVVCIQCIIINTGDQFQTFLGALPIRSQESKGYKRNPHCTCKQPNQKNQKKVHRSEENIVCIKY